jgi:hypothetical protein
MPIPGSGQVSLQDIETEFGGTHPIGLSEYYRGGGYVPNLPQNSRIPTAGTISNSDFYGSSFRVPIALNISSPAYNYNVYAQTIANPLYFPSLSDITVTVAPGVQVGSTATNTYAMSVLNSFNPTDTVTIVNNGFIQGKGGNGGDGGSGTGGVGGNALFAGRPVRVQNLGTIASGGGGGGGGAVNLPYKGDATPGGGGGGGAGYSPGSGGGGSYPGSPGTSNSGGAGNGAVGVGGNGGGRGANGQNGGGTSGGGGSVAGGSAGNTGYYIVGNPFVSWVATGTREGNVG